MEKKRGILDAASRVFRRKGLHATGMRDIAAEFGMAVEIGWTARSCREYAKPPGR